MTLLWKAKHFPQCKPQGAILSFIKSIILLMVSEIHFQKIDFQTDVFIF